MICYAYVEDFPHVVICVLKESSFSLQREGEEINFDQIRCVFWDFGGDSAT